MAASSVSLYLLHPPPPPPPPSPLTNKPKSRISSLKTTNPSLQITSSSISFTSFSSKRIISNPNPLHKNTQIWRISATTSEEIVSTTTANPVEDLQQLTASEDGSGISTTISVLLFIAFVGLSILTIGVVYIAVADFLQKREAEKFEKEEAAKKKNKKRGKKKVVRAKYGPRGFGQKIFEEEDDDDDDDDDGDA